MEPEVNANQNEEPKMTDPWWLPEFTNTVELADGTSLEGNAILNDIEDDLWVTLDKEEGMARAFGLFSDAEKTKVIISHTSILSTTTYEGYTRMALIREDGGQIKIRMKKPL